MSCALSFASQNQARLKTSDESRPDVEDENLDPEAALYDAPHGEDVTVQQGNLPNKNMARTNMDIGSAT